MSVMVIVRLIAIMSGWLHYKGDAEGSTFLICKLIRSLLHIAMYVRKREGNTFTVRSDQCLRRAFKIIKMNEMK